MYDIAWIFALLKDRKKIIKRVLKNVIKRAFGDLNNIFQEEFNKILSQQSMDVRFFLSHK